MSLECEPAPDSYNATMLDMDETKVNLRQTLINQSMPLPIGKADTEILEINRNIP